MMYRVLLALLAGKAAGFSPMPDPGCTALGPQTDAFPGIGVHFSPAGVLHGPPQLLDGAHA